MVTKLKNGLSFADQFLYFPAFQDAIDWAMKNNLWGHALFLASKMDSRAHANVMTRWEEESLHL